jgi:hypothetical protein
MPERRRAEIQHLVPGKDEESDVLLHRIWQLGRSAADFAAWLSRRIGVLHPVIDSLDLKRLRVLVPYLRGYGKSEALLPEFIGGQEAVLGSDLLTFADALGSETFHLAGHDWGARTSYVACIFAPKRIVSLASPYIMYGGRRLLCLLSHAFRTFRVQTWRRVCVCGLMVSASR